MVLIAIGIYYFFPEKKIPDDILIERIVVFKSKREMLVYSNNFILKTYKISLGKNPVGDKEFEGDNKTPEGIYFINAKNSTSSCYKNLGISYPNKPDIERAKDLGKQAGGDIKIHGIINGYGFIGKFHRWVDWTAGCIALTDEEMDEIFTHTPIGTQIEIKP